MDVELLTYTASSLVQYYAYINCVTIRVEITKITIVIPLLAQKQKISPIISRLTIILLILIKDELLAKMLLRIMIMTAIVLSCHRRKCYNDKIVRQGRQSLHEK